MSSALNGTGITFSNGSTQSVAWPGNTGTVTSVATGNGLSGGTITSSGTLSIAAPGTSTVGSYVYGSTYNVYTGYGNNYSPIYVISSRCCGYTTQLPGTWRSVGASSNFQGLFVRVS